MELVLEFLPNGHTLWKAVAAEYQNRSGESDERDPREMEKYWRFKMCNNYKKPTGGGGPKYELLLQCLGITRKIMGKSSATVLGGSSGDEESCVMMGRLKEDSSDEEDSKLVLPFLDGVSTGRSISNLSTRELETENSFHP